MDDLSQKIVDIIGTYRIGSPAQIDSEHVLNWVSQFEVQDQEFLLSELLHILPKSYLSKEMVIEEFNDIFEYLRKFYKYNSIVEFLSHAKFLRCQEENKSQTILLNFLNDISVKEYGLSLETNDNANIKHWLYIDDVLASGGTFKREISKEIEGYGLDKFKHDQISISPIFFFLHTWGMNVVKYAIKELFKIDLVFHSMFTIENDPRINYYNPSPAFNLAYPINEDNAVFENYLNELTGEKHRNFAYRPNKYPENETFYSSKENRNRYESIVLTKGIEILSKVEYLSPPIRPLGLTYPSYQTFGAGSHAFTWRNISNTCPIIYWWENHG